LLLFLSLAYLEGHKKAAMTASYPLLRNKDYLIVTFWPSKYAAKNLQILIAKEFYS
jgi:hypothetical protein